MHSFFRELIEYNIIGSLINNIQNIGGGATAIHLATIHVLAMLINPAFGNTFSFPWKRGPHDQINEYLDCAPTLEMLRIHVYKHFSEFDFLNALMSIYHSENEEEHLMTKVSVLRIITQIARIKKDHLVNADMPQLEQPTLVMVHYQTLVHTLNQVVASSKDHILISISLLLLHQLLKSILRSSNTRDASALQLDANRIFTLFDQNVSQGSKLISVISCGLMAEILSLEGQQAQFIFSKFIGQNDSLAKLNILIDINAPADTGEMKLLQGTNFGCPYAGFYDQPFNLLNKVQQKQIYENRSNKGRGDIMSLQGGSGLSDTIMTFLLNLNSKTDLSPKGFVHLLSFIHDSINNESRAFMQKIYKNCLKLLCSIIRDNQLLSIQEWPNSSGGGVPAACMVTTHILRIFNIPFN